MSNTNPGNLPARTPSPLHAIEPARASPDHFDDFGAPKGPTTDWRRLRSALWRYKWLVITLPMLSAAGGYGASRFVDKVYTARATVWINRQPDLSTTLAAKTDQFSSQAWIDLMRSYEVIDRVVASRHLAMSLAPRDSALLSSVAGFDENPRPGSYQLAVDPDGKTYVLTTMAQKTNDNVVVERGAVGGPIGKSIGLRWTPPASALPAGKTFSLFLLSPRQAALDLLDRLRITSDESGTFLHAELKSNEPHEAAATLNSVVQQFVLVAARLKSQGLTDRTRILGEQLKSAQLDLATAEHAQEQFREQSVMRSSAPSFSQRQPSGVQGTTDAANYATLQAAADAADRERQTIRRVLDQAPDSGLVVGKLEDLPSVKASSELSAALRDLTAKRAVLRDLRAKYTDLHPLVVQADSAVRLLERVQIPAMANRVIAALASRETDLTKSVATTEKDLKDSPGLASTEARLQRNVTLAEGLYTQLQPRFSEAQIAEQSAVADVRSLDPAEAPQYADTIVTTRLILIAFLAGLALACAGAFLLDRMDPKFRYPDQISRELGLSILGALPHVNMSSRNGKPPKENAAFQEAIRDLRMNVEYAYGSAGPLIFTVSSPGESDGKSFLASNLARSFAASGRRTLLIDADIRRGELHKRCGVTRRPGLTDCLRGVVLAEGIVQQTKFPRLDLVASGTRTHDAPELLQSPATAQLLGDFRSKYDVIICDSPPLSAGIDPFVLAALSGSLLVVVRTGVSVREIIESKLLVLGRMPVRILGAVLNDVPRSSMYGYYSSYIPGYDTSDESGAALERIIV